MKLTHTAITKAKPSAKPYKLADGGGMYLLVNPTGSKWWRLKYRFAGQEKSISLGVYPEVSLSEAREKREEAKRLLKQRIDPSFHRRIENTGSNTFAAIAKDWHDTNATRWTPGHRDMIWRRVEIHLLPAIGSRAIQDIKPSEILGAIRQIEKGGSTEVSHRVNQIASSIFRFAIASDKADYNPAADLKGALKPNQTKHYPSISYKELPDFFAALENANTHILNKYALELLMLTFVRPGELRKGKWEQIDYKDKLWIIPSESMKMKREHIVPLSKQSLKVLDKIQEVVEGPYMFPAQQRQKNPIMSENTLNKALRNMGYEGRMVAHGFRSLASTTINEFGWVHPDVIERQLAHIEPNKVKAAYNRAQYLEERRAMMQKWANFLDRARRSDLPATG